MDAVSDISLRIALSALVVCAFLFYLWGTRRKPPSAAPVAEERERRRLAEEEARRYEVERRDQEQLAREAYEAELARQAEARRLAELEERRETPVKRERPSAIKILQPNPVLEPSPQVQSLLAPQVSAKKKIFLSYRREDSVDVVGRIYDRLTQTFQQAQVFKDVDSIPLGVDFRKHLQRTVESCDVLLIVVGDRWLDSGNSSGARRIDDPKDFVRIELEVALQRDIPVIPLLVRGATVPRETELPQVLASLSYRNGTSIRPDPDFHRDMDRLIQSLQTYLAGESSPT